MTSFCYLTFLFVVALWTLTPNNLSVCHTGNKDTGLFHKLSLGSET